MSRPFRPGGSSVELIASDRPMIPGAMPLRYLPPLGDNAILMPHLGMASRVRVARHSPFALSMWPRWGILVQFYGQSRISQVTLGKADWPRSPAFRGGKGWCAALALGESAGLRQDRHRMAWGKTCTRWLATQGRFKFAHSMTAPMATLPDNWPNIEPDRCDPHQKLPRAGGS